MYVRPFGYERVDSLEEACDLLRSHGEGAKAIAGGQSLMPMINLGLVEPTVVIDISRIKNGRGVSETDGFLRIGALTRHRELEADAIVLSKQPLVAVAARNIGNVRARAIGTLGGSVSHADPTAELPLVMTAIGAEYEVTDGRTVRRMPAAEFPLSYFTTQLAEDELVSAAFVPTLGPGWYWGFEEVSRRRGDFAIVAAAAVLRFAGEEIVEARLALAGVGNRPLRLPSIEMALAGARRDDVEGRVGPIEGLEPVTDVSATAELRRRLARVLTIRAVVQACRRAEAEAA